MIRSAPSCFGREHAEQPNGTIADDGDGLSRADLGGDRAEPAGAEDVGRGEQARDQDGRGRSRSIPSFRIPVAPPGRQF